MDGYANTVKTATAPRSSFRRGSLLAVEGHLEEMHVRAYSTVYPDAAHTRPADATFQRESRFTLNRSYLLATFEKSMSNLNQLLPNLASHSWSSETDDVYS